MLTAGDAGARSGANFVHGKAVHKSSSIGQTIVAVFTGVAFTAGNRVHVRGCRSREERSRIRLD